VNIFIRWHLVTEDADVFIERRRGSYVGINRFVNRGKQNGKIHGSSLYKAIMNWLGCKGPIGSLYSSIIIKKYFYYHNNGKLRMDVNYVVPLNLT
jgi:hypothetical protein